MSGPKFRFTIVVGFLLIVWWAWNIASTYLLGQQGLNFSRYGLGVAQLGLAATAGFGLVWLAIRMAESARRGKTGFEAEVRDEYGTLFKMGAAKEPFPMQLAKFLPDIIAAPTWPGLSPLEAELIGFLNGYRHWPADLDHGQESLTARAMARWEVMRTLPGAGQWHRIMALSADLGKIYAYREVRVRHPLKHFWKRDKVRFERRTREHGGLAAFVLSTLPGFRALSLDRNEEVSEARRALLTALRYMDDPRLLPTNTSGLSREILEFWQRSESIMASRLGDIITPSEAEITELRLVIQHNLSDLIADLAPGEAPSDDADAVALPHERLLVRPTSLLAVLGRNLTSDMRQRFQLWEGAGVHHPVWTHVVEELKALEIWVPLFMDLPQPTHGWEFSMDGTLYGPACLLEFTHVHYLQHRLANLPVWKGNLEPKLGTDDVKQFLAAQAEHVESLLEKHF